MSGFRDAILFDAISCPPTDGADRRPRSKRETGRGTRAPGTMAREREKREVSGLPRFVRERPWKGGY